MAGDFDPTKPEEVHMDMVEFKDIYEEYVADMKNFFHLSGMVDFVGCFGKRSHM